MKKDLVSHTIDLANPPPLTEEQKAEIAALAALPEDEIDTSDIPVMPDDFWKNAVRGRFYKPRKTSTTVRIDSDVLAWLRAGGRGYQTRMNAILRRAMLEQLNAKRRRPRKPSGMQTG
jgi:uncharacterized protein (DUF4415 family)